ncbi:uncharacterized protein BYT42DRAFT_190758 [Radiomyces spectabilis]|uniref:uncharacterized protein n=1 Tax=Radiomyces spectabilis TaxID=64574 RepID=UPI00221EAA8C|nr:uncharacterized protein BYT42DRAFT_190758 [Radiomyces spectabilis]KAI8391339.1 hypothetical protein BYT42DRAFT_190758 [Radiomyces spectabilis]
MIRGCFVLSLLAAVLSPPKSSSEPWNSQTLSVEPFLFGPPPFFFLYFTLSLPPYFLFPSFPPLSSLFVRTKSRQPSNTTIDEDQHTGNSTIRQFSNRHPATRHPALRQVRFPAFRHFSTTRRSPAIRHYDIRHCGNSTIRRFRHVDQQLGFFPSPSLSPFLFLFLTECNGLLGDPSKEGGGWRGAVVWVERCGRLGETEQMS